MFHGDDYYGNDWSIGLTPPINDYKLDEMKKMASVNWSSWNTLTADAELIRYSNQDAKFCHEIFKAATDKIEERSPVLTNALHAQKIKDAQAAVEKATKKLEELLKPKRFYSQPAPGTMIKFIKRYYGGGTSYNYVALRVGSVWVLTGTGATAQKSYEWDELVKFIGNSRAWYLTVREEIPNT